MSFSRNYKVDEKLFQKFRPIFSLYLKRGFLISSHDLNGDLDGFLPGEADWILDWFKEEFESFYSANYKDHIKLLNRNNGSKVDALNLKNEEIKEHFTRSIMENDNKLLDCPFCGKIVRLSDLNIKKQERGKLTDCIVYHPQENGVMGHAIMLYVDSQLKVRGKKVIENISFQ
ncbi:MAG: hypothetical protein ACTSR8_08660 [Promethearchaeota archaeon]